MQLNCASLIALIQFACYCQCVDYDKYKLIWFDDFNGDKLDRSKWYHLVDCTGRGNRELQCYTNRTDNVRLENGHLVITAKAEVVGDKQYTSGRIHTSGKGWTYGRFEARARLPKGKHLWPAIWLVPTSGVYGPWPQSGEIDIMEARGQNSSHMEGTLHFGQSRKIRSKRGSGQTRFGFDLSDDFHVFGLEWTPSLMVWSVDGYDFFSVPLTRLFNVRGSNFYTKKGQPFDQNFKWILNVAVGGNYFHPSVYGKLAPGEAAQWAKPTMEVDWVRVYQARNDTPATTRAPVSTGGLGTPLVNSTTPLPVGPVRPDVVLPSGHPGPVPGSVGPFPDGDYYPAYDYYYDDDNEAIDNNYDNPYHYT
ncbi:Glucan endo-1,3-beta-glucosidase A1 [Halotydeus destructor]|nr:Glucan endo-1,3-beta-glucosidase A1 [Halotydeus destructor]